MNANQRVLLRHRPRGAPLAGDFELVATPLPALREGEFLVHNLYCSLDPAMRRWMDEESYAPPIPLGAPVRCSVFGRIAESRCPGFEVGDHLFGIGGVENYSVMTPGGFTTLVDPTDVASPTNYLSIFGAVGLSAYFGLIEVGKPREGETVLVSGAAGGVGSIAGQIARIQGCRAVGIAGGAEKCARLIDRYGFDAAIDYKGKDLAALTAEVKRACPGGVDIFFDNVGGVALDAALANLNNNARLVMCGMISTYNADAPEPGPTNLFQIVGHTATMQGFLIRNYVSRLREGIAALKPWVDEGRIRFDEHVDEGIENFHASFSRLFDGTNQGKLILKL